MLGSLARERILPSGTDAREILPSKKEIGDPVT